MLFPAWCSSALASSQKAAEKLTDLPPAAQASISASLGRKISDYGAKPLGSGFRAVDPQRHFTADFLLEGVAVRSGESSWKLKVTGYGHGNTLKAVSAASPTVDANRVQYNRAELTEWYVNGPMGLEQGFSFDRRPANLGRGPLTVALELGGNLETVQESDHALSVADRHGRVMFHYTGLSASDAAGRDLKAWMDLRGGQLLLHVDDRNARYPVVIDPWVQVAEIGASDGGGTDQFGWSVGISGSVVVVGSPFHTVNGNASQGVAYVFEEPGSGWANMTESAELTASDGATNAFLGGSVAIYGNTIVAGAGGTTISGNPRQGAVYVFEEPANGWTNMTETAKLTASDGYVGDDLGASVSINSTTIVAGAPYAGVGNNYEQGAAYVFVQPKDGWVNATQTAKLTASDGAPSDILGVAVSVNGSTVVAGASEATVNGYTSAGAAYVFVAGANGWTDMTQTAKLTASDSALDNYFGTAVDQSSNTIVVGAPSDFSGAAYVFVQPANGWSDMTQTAELTPSNATSQLLAGGSVAIAGNVVVAGAAAAKVNGNANAGELLVFVEPQGGWTDMNETTRLYASDENAGDAFGESISVGNVAGVASSPFHVNSSNGAQGVSYVFQALNSKPELTSLLPNNTDAGGASFTLTVNGSSFVNGTVVNWAGSPRSTTFVSSSEVQATILASDISQPGAFKVSATNPPPGGGNSRNSLTFTVNDGAPTILSIKPSTALAGGQAFTLTVNGSGFVPKSKVMWGSTQLETTYVNSAELTANVSAKDIENAGTVQVTVFNPAPGGGTSNPATFTIDNPVPSLTQLEPSSIKAGSPGFTLTVKGTGFVSTTQAYWNGSARNTTYGGPGSLKVDILASDIQTPGTAKVTAANPAPGGGKSNSLTFTINQ